jgi:nucleoid DNA-binding protein
MKKKEFVERLAQARHIPLHAAADLLDSILHDLLKTLKEGRSRELPAGIGELKAPAVPTEVQVTRPGGAKARR